MIKISVNKTIPASAGIVKLTFMSSLIEEQSLIFLIADLYHALSGARVARGKLAT